MHFNENHLCQELQNKLIIHVTLNLNQNAPAYKSVSIGIISNKLHIQHSIFKNTGKTFSDDVENNHSESGF